MIAYAGVVTIAGTGDTDNTAWLAAEPLTLMAALPPEYWTVLA